MNTLLICSLVAATLISPGIGSAVGQVMTGTRLSMIKMVHQLEAEGYGRFSELSMDNGNWEVEVYKNGQKRELLVDLRTGKVVADRIDD